MADDEEVVFEGHELHKYLQQVGFNDFNVERPVGSFPPSPDNEQRVTSHSNYLKVTSSYVDSAFKFLKEPWMSRVKHADHLALYKLLQTILDSGLLFEDDVQFVNNVLPSNNRSNTTVSKRSWRNATISMIASFPSVCLNIWQDTALPIAGFVLFDVLWIWNKNKTFHHHVENQKQLLLAMKDLYVIFSKTMRLLQENELILRGFTLARTGSTVSRLELSDLPCMIRKWDSSPGLRIAVKKALSETLSIFANSTQRLISCCPLFGQLDNTSHYVAFMDFGGLSNTEDSEVKLSHLKRLHNVYLLLQSEFLRRLALCYCPSLWKGDSLKHVKDVMHIISNVVEQCSKLCSNLTLEYNVFYCYEISDKIEQSRLKPLINNSEFLDGTGTKIAVRSTSLHLRTILLKTRELEEKLETSEGDQEENLENVVSHLSDIILQLDMCRSCCEEGILQIKKLITPNQEEVKSVEAVPAVPCVVDSNAPVKLISVGYTDLDPQVEDEIFEATITNSEGSGTSYACDEGNTEEHIQYEAAKQLSKRMMQELKSVLAVKAEKWKEREAKVLQAKPSPDLVDSEKSNSTRHVIYDSKEDISSHSGNTERNSASPDCLQNKINLSSSCLSIDQKGSPRHRLLREQRDHLTSSCSSLERCTDSPVSNASSSSRATSNRSPKHVYASETFRPLKNDLQFSVGLHLSSDALAKFQARHIEASDTFSGVGEKSSSEESLVDN